uniref:Uncharacterized protein n=1 Tax=Cyclophora tenuis TaxID=216820 RepID=A0A7S1D7J0_CYCTE
MFWGSFVSSSWFDVHLRIQVSWMRELFNGDATDTILQHMNLASILSTLKETQQQPVLVLIIITAIVIPLLSIIYYPVSLIVRHRDFVTGRQGRKYWNLMDPFVRFSIFVVWILLFLDLATSFISLHWTGSVISVHNRIESGLAAYILGCTAVVVLAVIMRVGQKNIPSRTTSNLPSEAEISPYMEEDEPAREPLLGPSEEQDRTSSDVTKRCMARISRFLIFESGLVAILMLITSFFEPILKVRYSGLAAEFLPSREQSIHLGQLPSLLWMRGDAAGTKHWILLISGASLVLQTFIVPLSTLLLAFGTADDRKWLAFLYPAVNPLSLTLALLVIVPILERVPEYLLEQETSGLCQDFDVVLGESCLVLDSKLGIGAWCWAAHSVLLEVFMLLSIA